MNGFTSVVLTLLLLFKNQQWGWANNGLKR
jgi:hypothetical protein